MNPILSQLARGVSDVVFPPVCVHCRALVEPDEAGLGGGTVFGIFAAGARPSWSLWCRRIAPPAGTRFTGSWKASGGV